VASPTGLLAIRANGLAAKVGVGLLLGAIAMAAKAVLVVVTGEDIAYLSLFAVLVPAAVIGGRVGGLTCVLAGAIADVLLFQDPIGSPAIGDAAVLVRFVVYLPTATAMVLILSSLDDHRRAAADSASRFEALMDALPDATVLLDSEGRVRYVNDAALGLGLEPAGLVGKPLQDSVRGPRSDGLADTDDVPATVALLADDGTEVPVDVSKRAVTLPDGRPGSTVTLRDARPRLDDEIRLIRLARAERQRTDALRTVIATLSDGVGLFDRDGLLIAANDALARLAGHPVAERQDLPDAWLTGEGAAIASGEPARWVRITLHQIDEEGGGGTLVVATDETAMMEAAALRDAFIGVMSHELRTPVTTVLAAAHLLERRAGSLDSTSADLALDIRAEATRLNELIEDLLVLSRAQVGAMVVDAEPVLIQHAIAQVVRAESTRYPGVTFTTDIEPNLPPVSGDRTYVGQILRNLIGNAGKYSLDDPAVVTVVAGVEEDHVVVRVLDQGAGFDPSLASRLFEIYFRAESTAKARTGSGIGLYVSRTLVEAMDGRIWANPRIGQGSEFGFSLPIDRTDDEADTIAAPGTDVPVDESGGHGARLTE
jgi:PAS domain S-box-containing protein